ncbi:MAG: capsular polysaccharide biosynthesis protein [Kordiimonadaceae bacterium]|nr:capsular polysaccharide biosynthesis protein [Kordiimonadaceae bacterium]
MTDAPTTAEVYSGLTAKRAFTTSWGILRDKALPHLLSCPVKYGLRAKEGDVVIGWAEKTNTDKARAYAKKRGIPYWRLEDGFLGYLSHPNIDKRRLSIIVDTTGVYYDAHSPSDLERILNDDSWITPELTARAEDAMARMRRWRLSKYNQSPMDVPRALAEKLTAYKGPKVLVVDQTFGDQSITAGMASDAVFANMLDDALAENPTSLVLVKIHPDVLLGTKKGHYDVERTRDRVMFVADDVAPQALMELVDQVYVATSQMGLEGLISGKKVTCYGLPFYAGWGLTHDKQLCEARIANRTLPELFAAAFIVYSRYADPYSGERVEIERILDLLIAERKMPRLRAKRTFAVGFSVWKRGFIPEFIGKSGGKVEFTTPCALADLQYQQGDAVVLWGRKHDEAAQKIPESVAVWRMEDGFLRSVGLGSDLKRPSSLVLDRAGIYYDGSCPSDLEVFLASHDFDEHDIARGAALREKMLKLKVSKYNVGEKGALDFAAKANGKRIILVPGQVEADASIQYGSPVLKSNAGLLEVVKDANPDDYIIFKPHPDVASGNRSGAVPADILARCADDVITDADIVDVIEAVDVIATMTSLTGFEALLRGKKVITYGIPFYAGWGLTEDICPLPGRGRVLPLDALVYALLCVYARYVDWPSGETYSPEALVADIAANAKSRKIAGGPIAPIARLGRKAKYLTLALLR